MKKNGNTKIIVIVILCIIGVLSSCVGGCFAFLYETSNMENLIEGIDRFNYYFEYTLTRYLTLYYDSSSKQETVLDFFEYELAYFRYYEYHTTKQKPYVSCATAMLSIQYNEKNYADMVAFIDEQPGLDKTFSWEYGNYLCFVNKTADLESKSQMSFFDIESENKSIQWINIVCFSQDDKTVCFLGVYYHEYEKMFNYNGKNSSDFVFTEWNQFYNKFFSFYDWGTDN